MDILNDMMDKKRQEIIYNISYGNSSDDNVIFYDIFYNNDAKLTYIENFNEEFSSSSFIKKLLYDIKNDNNIKSLRVVITNKKYKHLSASKYFSVCEALDMDNQLLSNIDQVEEKIKMYHLLSSKKFNKYDNFTDQDYKLANSLVDIINSHEKLNFGYIVNHIYMTKVHSDKHKKFIAHQIASSYSINQDPFSKLISGNVYKGINFKNNTSKNYMVKSYTQEEYLKNHNFWVINKSLLRSFPYLTGYILELMSWKYIHKTNEIPSYVYDEKKQNYINADYKVKEYKV